MTLPPLDLAHACRTAFGIFRVDRGAARDASSASFRAVDLQAGEGLGRALLAAA